MTGNEMHRTGPATIGRRGVLLLAVASATGAIAGSAAPGHDVPAIMTPLPAPLPQPRKSVRLKPVSYWTGIFERSWDYSTENFVPQSGSNDSWDHYNLAYSVDATVAMFRATGRTRYLDRALEYVENVMATSVVSAELPNSGFHDRYRGWASQQPDLDRVGDEIPLYESYFWRYGTALLVALRQTDAAYRNEAYRRRYNALLRFAEVNIFEKWYTRSPAKFIYRERTHMASHWALIALNLSMLTQDAGRKARYLEVADNIDLHLPGLGTGLRGQMRRNPVEPTAYFWSDVWGSAKRPGQDVSHANGVMAYVVEGHDRGRPWSDRDMAAFSTLLTKVIWPADRTYKAFVDGSGSDNGWFSDGFVKLGRNDPTLQLRLEGHRVVNDQFAGNMALNARLLMS